MLAAIVGGFEDGCNCYNPFLGNKFKFYRGVSQFLGILIRLRPRDELLAGSEV